MGLWLLSQVRLQFVYANFAKVILVRPLAETSQSYLLKSI